MKLEWMGPYRPLVEEYIKAANRCTRRYRRPGFTWQGLPASAACSSFIREALFGAVFAELRALPPEALEASLRVLRLINATQA